MLGISYNHPVFGKYIKHATQNNLVYDGKYINFPISSELIIEFEKMRIQLVAFNVSQDCLDKINNMNPQELLKDFDVNNHNLYFYDDVNLIYEIQELRQATVENIKKYKNKTKVCFKISVMIRSI